MANAVANIAKQGIANGTIDLDTHDIRVLAVKTGSAAEANIVDADTISGIATLTEMAASGYARQTLAGKTVTVDDTNNRALFSANAITFAGLATGETMIGLVVFKFVATDSDHIPICFLDVTDTPTNGGDIVITFTNGILRLD